MFQLCENVSQTHVASRALFRQTTSQDVLTRAIASVLRLCSRPYLRVGHGVALSGHHKHDSEGLLEALKNGFDTAFVLPLLLQCEQVCFLHTPASNSPPDELLKHSQNGKKGTTGVVSDQRSCRTWSLSLFAYLAGRCGFLE